MEFQGFPKMPRLTREMIITEKIDGTNAQIVITEEGDFRVASRTRFITPTDDNYGFATWCYANQDELMKLGHGRHFGEWWGKGIQRNYGMKERRFSLFNVSRWSDPDVRPACCDVVPTLYTGMFNTQKVDDICAALRRTGSQAAPGFMNPEGIIVWHVAGNFGFKKTLEHDEVPKSMVK